MKKIIIGLVLMSLLLGLFIAPIALARNAQPKDANGNVIENGNEGGGGGNAGGGQQWSGGFTNWTITNIFRNIGTVLLGLLILVAVVFFVIAGFYFVTAAGDPEKIKIARMFVLWALVGVAVALAGWALVKFAGTLVGA